MGSPNNPRSPDSKVPNKPSQPKSIASSAMKKASSADEGEHDPNCGTKKMPDVASSDYTKPLAPLEPSTVDANNQELNNRKVAPQPQIQGHCTCLQLGEHINNIQELLASTPSLMQRGIIQNETRAGPRTSYQELLCLGNIPAMQSSTERMESLLASRLPERHELVILMNAVESQQERIRRSLSPSQIARCHIHWDIIEQDNRDTHDYLSRILSSLISSLRLQRGLYESSNADPNVSRNEQHLKHRVGLQSNPLVIMILGHHAYVGMFGSVAGLAHSSIFRQPDRIMFIVCGFLLLVLLAAGALNLIVQFLL
ncbi:hypothetical protein Sjap_020312 [Stephania japonica]|uniref:Uncharacterized protein n=1 Tax=Stephania japonica TaxID=461633 RepID=A0AAP0F7U5_9MAGN